jgi:hypothetical protein
MFTLAEIAWWRFAFAALLLLLTIAAVLIGVLYSRFWGPLARRRWSRRPALHVVEGRAAGEVAASKAVAGDREQPCGGNDALDRPQCGTAVARARWAVSPGTPQRVPGIDRAIGAHDGRSSVPRRLLDRSRASVL